MNKFETVTKMNNKINRIKITGRKYSPEILLLVGIAGAITGTILACVATTKIDNVEEQKVEELKDVHDRLDDVDPEGVVESDNLQEIKKETTAIYFKTGVRYAVLYSPAIIVSGLSLSCLVASNVILRRRLVGVTAAYATMVTSFREYRDRVSDRYGADVEKEIRYNIQQKEISNEFTDKKGNVKTKTEKVKIQDPSTICDFARIYDDGNIGWSKDPQANLMFLKCQQAAATQKLKADGYLFLNEVYGMLGFPKTKEGQVAGWIYDEKNPVGDNFVDFGIYDVNNERVRDFVNGYERNIVLDFNIDGPILEFI